MFLFKRSSKGVSMEFQRRFKEVSRVLKKKVKCVLRKFQKKVSRVFQECFNEVLFCDFVLAATQAEGGLVFSRPKCNTKVTQF